MSDESIDLAAGGSASEDAVLEFWFGAPDSADYGKPRSEWFRKDPDFDRLVRDRFAGTIERALAGDFADWMDRPSGALALVLLLDQFTRNAFRDTARAFAGDSRALAVAEQAVGRGHDRKVPPVQRTFFYLPFEHAESMAAQHRSLQLFSGLAAETGTDAGLEWARRHAAIIERFGRYPHRNATLGRESTAEETAFLRQPGSSF